MNRKILIIDMGGVLVDLDIEDCKRAFKDYLGYDEIDSIIDACHQKGIYGDLEEGTLSAEDFRRIVLADSRPGASEEGVDKAMWHILVGVEPYKIQMLKKLSESYDLYMLRRQAVQVAEIVVDIWQILHYFSRSLHIFDSICIVILSDHLISHTGSGVAGIIHR